MGRERNIKIVLEYDGSRYDGWQRQGNTDNTIQGKLEAVLGRMAGEPVEAAGSGRTDAGVHALGQVANFHLPASFALGEPGYRSAEQIREYLNQYLPEDIRVLSAREVGERFHSRLNAVEKTYRYQVETGEKKCVFQRKYTYGLGETLDLEAMRTAAVGLAGTHDFKSFCSQKRMKKSTVRTLRKIEIEKQGTGVTFIYKGDGFLYNMVRILTGTLIEVGLGKRSPQAMREILEAKDRQAAGFTAPAEGLFLESVAYSQKEIETRQ